VPGAAGAAAHGLIRRQPHRPRRRAPRGWRRRRPL